MSRMVGTTRATKQAKTIQEMTTGERDDEGDDGEEP